MSSSGDTSLSKMRTLQFNDKMALLNRDFLKSLRIWYEQCPHFDFSDTVRSYLKHIAELEKMYGLKNTSPDVTDENNPVSNIKEDSSTQSERKIAKARRRLNDPSKLNESVAVSTPARAPPRFSLGDVSAIQPVSTPEDGSNAATQSQGGRKRVIRGGGPDGGAESVHFRGNEATQNTLNLPPVNITLPKPSAGFWDKHKDKTHSGTLPVVNLVKPAQAIVPPGSEIVAKDDEQQKPLFSFGTFEKKTDANGGIENADSAKSKIIESPKSSELFSTLGKKDDSNKTAISFPSFAPKKQDENGEPKPGLCFPSFQNSGSKLVFGVSSTQLKFGTSTTNSDEAKEEEEGEYIPPKAEIVENDEPGATFSVKCSVFKMVDKKYEKLGVGMLHLKEVDGKKSILVRAATAIGTVWINALINATMRIVKADEKGEKLRITIPISSTEMGSFLIRFPSVAVAEKVQHHVEDNSK